MIAFVLRWTGAIALVVSAMMFVLHSGSAAAQGGGGIEVHVAACPDDIGERSFFDACHANGITGDEIILDGPVRMTGVTSGNLGAVRFDGLPAGEYTLAEAQMTGDFSEYRVFCSDASGADVPVDYRGNGRAAVAFTLTDGAEITCDWYNIPPQVTTAVTTMPATGSGPIGGPRALGINLGVLVGASVLLAVSGWLLRRSDPLT